ncbi:acyl-CoA dehydrogenase [Alicycliphilus denitrificans]|uniref:acyl-CoA dehydrogenase n=1 Tax=Alicycliphilus denitrificans TaxID=179636 RepID=UPI0019150FD4|nr:acyl-CoA dehydrogenase [Alicycliphilus denitrificans]MBN9574179.1 acyl-CoA dehydrogenase [Alicycliphilus denitrificans]BCN38383.1 acyl-CoA dehydrogenase [Alicycliphilus denitrificans]
MTTSLRSTLDFLLYDWLRTESLTTRPRFADHSRETFDAVLDTCERIAREKYAPFNRTVDTQEPRFDGEKVILPQCTHDARQAYADSGMLGAAQDYELGGMQLPYVVESAANSFFACASISIGSNLLTTGNANAILVHGTPMQQRVFAANEFNGRWAGTMCLSEPQAGSSLSDIATRAEPDGAGFEADPLGPRYRLRGNKMWISAGDHELTENIVHLVLAKIPGPDGKPVPGVKGISLFIVPKKLVDTEGQLTGERNDVALAGLNHKLGWRGTTNTLLNFGEGRYPVRGGVGAIGYLVGKPGEGLKCMFHMMNEARISIGMAATMLGLAGYYASLDYARTRLQGRPIGSGGKDASSPQVRLIEHADVKRMLLAQKSYGEGALALNLYCARLVDEGRTGDAGAAADARLLLEVLTPIAKSWPSEFCLEANSLAIQIHGGYGYTRDFPVEQYWRDNRLNMIHEGTHGIQAADLLGRKVVMQGGAGLQLLARTVAATIAKARQRPELAAWAGQLEQALQDVIDATRAAWATGSAGEALANAVPYMQAFGHVVLAWVWLDVADRVLAKDASLSIAASAGRMGAARYFFHYELPKTGAWLAVVRTRDATCADMAEDAF